MVVRQRGSHIRLQKRTERGTLKIALPAHNPLKKSTLHRILTDIGMDLQRFLDLLK